MKWKGMSTVDCNAGGLYPVDPQEMQVASEESALLGPMSSDWCDTLTHALVAEP